MSRFPSRETTRLALWKVLIHLRERLESDSRRQTSIVGLGLSNLRMKRILPFLVLVCVLTNGAVCAATSEGCGGDKQAVPILLYHRFGHEVPGEMWVSDATFAWQLEYLKDHHYTVIPLHALVNYLRGKGPAPPARSVVVTADDGHRSVFSDMQPLVEQYRIPVTLFIYPSAISNAPYAMTWPQLTELIRTGRFEVESHTYWHPNFLKDKARLSREQYATDVRIQLGKSKQMLERRLGIEVDLLAWPFGIFDRELIQQAREAGYVAAFSLERRPATKKDSLMALPRYIVTDGERGARFARLLGECTAPQGRAGTTVGG
jgi:peptidoglycan/xylan/chitin deacetylase (PgdA/CDA1 family)